MALITPGDPNGKDIDATAQFVVKVESTSHITEHVKEEEVAENIHQHASDMDVDMVQPRSSMNGFSQVASPIDVHLPSTSINQPYSTEPPPFPPQQPQPQLQQYQQDEQQPTQQLPEGLIAETKMELSEEVEGEKGEEELPRRLCSPALEWSDNNSPFLGLSPTPSTHNDQSPSVPPPVMMTLTSTTNDASEELEEQEQAGQLVSAAIATVAKDDEKEEQGIVVGADEGGSGQTIPLPAPLPTMLNEEERGGGGSGEVVLVTAGGDQAAESHRHPREKAGPDVSTVSSVVSMAAENANNNKNSSRVMDAETTIELLAHIHFYLAEKPEFAGVADQLKAKMEESGHVPTRYDFSGRPRPQSIDNYLHSMRPYATSLDAIVSRLDQLINTDAGPQSSSASLQRHVANRLLPIRLFASKRMALTRGSTQQQVAAGSSTSSNNLTTTSLQRKVVVQEMGVGLLERLTTPRVAVGPLSRAPTNRLLAAREIGATRTTPLPISLLLSKSALAEQFQLHSRILGHLASVYSIRFDQTGRYIFTGADDHLVKVWDARTCLLRFTFRGHTAEIVDMGVSTENTLLASASNDKTLRVWSLQRGSNIYVYRGHTAPISSVHFLPFVFNNSGSGSGEAVAAGSENEADLRYIVSAGLDCRVVFFRYNAKTNDFGKTHVFLFDERSTPGRKMLSACHSPAGNLVAMGDSHHEIRLYHVTASNVERTYEFHAHSSQVDSLVWSNASLRFASGSKDGKAKVWSLQPGKIWKATELVVSPLPSACIETTVFPCGRKKKKQDFKVDMVRWTLRDDFVVTSSSDYLLRVWDWRDGSCVRELKGHVNDSFVLWPHPVHPNLFSSTSYDGTIIVWDVYTGAQVIKWSNDDAESHAPLPIFDMVWSPDGAAFAYVDCNGQLSVVGSGGNHRAELQPKEQFHNTDYHPLVWDENGYCLDDNTGLAPECMEPPWLTNSHNEVYPDNIQRQVAGRDFHGASTSVTPLLCPWATREIVPPLGPSSLARTLAQRGALCAEELAEYERLLRAPIAKPSVDPTEGVRPSSSSSSQRHRNKTARARRASKRSSNANQQQPQPRVSYVLDEQYVSDANDSTYSVGAFADGGDGELRQRGSSSLSSGESGIGEADEALNIDASTDEDDSDYEVGHEGHDTVYRHRSNYTVTGRRRTNLVRARREAEQNAAAGIINNDADNEASRDGFGDGQEGSSQGPPRRPRRRLARSSGSLRQLALGQEASSSRGGQVRSGSEAVAEHGSGAGRKRGAIKTRSQRAVIDDSSSQSQEEEMEADDQPTAPLDLKGSKRRRSAREEKRSSGRSRRAAKLEVQSEDEPSLSSQQPTRRKSGGERRGKEENSGGALSASSVVVNYPEWLRQTKPRRFPYFAQLGDVVVYFAQGHQKYISAVVDYKPYHLTSKMLPRDDLDTEEVCIVEGVHYINQPYFLCRLRLSQYRNGSRVGGLSFELYFHDMENVADFIVLKQHYDEAMRHNFKVGDAVESIVDDKWYTGVVIDRKPQDVDYPQSQWNSVRIRWDNGEEPENEGYAPWDLGPKSRGRKSEQKATEGDFRSLADYEPIEGDWPSLEGYLPANPRQAKEAYLKRAKQAIAQISECFQAKNFLYPVNLNTYSDYSQTVPYPSDLQTIDQRIKNGFYRRSLSLLQDVQYIGKNAYKYNKPSELICWNASALVEAFFQYMEDTSIPHAGELFDELAAGTKICTRYKQALRAPPNARRQEEDRQQLPLLGSMKRVGGGVGATTHAAQGPSPSKWLGECRELARQVLDQLATSDEFNANASEEGKQSLRDLVYGGDGGGGEAVERFTGLNSPEVFREEISDILKEFKDQVEEACGIRSQTYKLLLKLESELQSKSKPICAKFNKMKNSANTTTTNSTSKKQPRAAAVNAERTWKRSLGTSSGDRNGPSSTDYNNPHHHSHQQRYHTRSSGSAFPVPGEENTISAVRQNQPTTQSSATSKLSTFAESFYHGGVQAEEEEEEEEEDPNKPCSSRSLRPQYSSTSHSALHHLQPTATTFPPSAPPVTRRTSSQLLRVSTPSIRILKPSLVSGGAAAAAAATVVVPSTLPQPPQSSILPIPTTISNGPTGLLPGGGGSIATAATGGMIPPYRVVLAAPQEGGKGGRNSCVVGGGRGVQLRSCLERTQAQPSVEDSEVGVMMRKESMSAGPAAAAAPVSQKQEIVEQQEQQQQQVEYLNPYLTNGAEEVKGGYYANDGLQLQLEHSLSSSHLATYNSSPSPPEVEDKRDQEYQQEDDEGEEEDEEDEEEGADQGDYNDGSSSVRGSQKPGDEGGGESDLSLAPTPSKARETATTTASSLLRGAKKEGEGSGDGAWAHEDQRRWSTRRRSVIQPYSPRRQERTENEGRRVGLRGASGKRGPTAAAEEEEAMISSDASTLGDGDLGEKDEDFTPAPHAARGAGTRLASAASGHRGRRSPQRKKAKRVLELPATAINNTRPRRAAAVAATTSSSSNKNHGRYYESAESRSDEWQ